MLALAAIDEALYEEGINGGPVAGLHDEIVLEVPIAERMAERERAKANGGGPFNGSEPLQ